MTKANRGDAEAQYQLGVCYKESLGGLDCKVYLAALWFRDSAKQNYGPACFNLGLCYEEGNGVSQNKKKALKYYQRATKYRYAHARFFLANHYEDGTGVVKQNIPKAKKLYRLASEQNYPGAENELERCERENREESSKCSIM